MELLGFLWCLRRYFLGFAGFSAVRRRRAGFKGRGRGPLRGEKKREISGFSAEISVFWGFCGGPNGPPSGADHDGRASDPAGGGRRKGVFKSGRWGYNQGVESGWGTEARAEWVAVTERWRSASGV